MQALESHSAREKGEFWMQPIANSDNTEKFGCLIGHVLMT